jgi:hypothetical protein
MYYSLIKNNYIALLFRIGKISSMLLILMVLSDAQPIQFWPAECDTFNQHLSSGVHHRCFCQPFNCDDPITIQGYVEEDSSPPVADDYTVTVYDDEDGEIAVMPMDVQEIGNRFVYSLSFIPSEFSPDLCDRRIKFEIDNATTVTAIAKSDCIDIGTHLNTILATYYNHRNFAGLIYEDASPEFEFNIRIPAIFYHQRFPEEDETMELSSSLVSLNSDIKRQRLLDVDYVPYYFHEKLKLILKHQFVTIYNKEWVKQEAYEITEGDRRWPIKKAKCWISEKEFVHRNVL